MRIAIDRRLPSAALKLLAGCALAALMAGCATKVAEEEPLHTGSITSSATVIASDLDASQAQNAIQKWQAAYTRNEKDKVAALNYSAALRASGETGQAVAVMRKAAIYHTEDREVLAAYGKALASDGQFRQALETVQRAQRSDNPDWRLLATEGGILDSLGQHDTARERYRQALVLAPGEPQILNNLGLSYLLTDELAAAEKALREAAASPKATLKTKKNLALVLRLRGKQGDGDIPPAALNDGGEPENTWDALAKI